MQYGSEHESLLRAVLYDPDDDAPRLIYADYLDERDDCLMAEFIRLQIAIYRGTDQEYDCPECGGYTTHRLMPFSLIKKLCDRCNATGKLVGRTPLVKRDQELWEQIETRFNVPYATGIRVERGFVASVTSRTRHFLKHASAMFTWPVTYVRLSDKGAHDGWVLEDGPRRFKLLPRDWLSPTQLGVLRAFP